MTELDFSGERWDQAARVFDGIWVIAHKHNPGLNKALELNNRTFVFRLRNKAGQDVLFVYGCAAQPAIDAVKALEKETGLAAAFIVSNGGAHHLFLDLWFRAFPNARVLIPAKRIPFTANGKRLQESYPDRWELLHGPRPQQIVEEFGDQIDVVVFDQLFSYKDETSVGLGVAESHASAPTNVDGFRLMSVFMKQMKDTQQPTDELFLFHKQSGLVIAGHNYQLSYMPKGRVPKPEYQLRMGGFPINLMMMMMMPKGAFKSSFEGAPGPIADSKLHAEAWETVLGWDFKAWTSSHDPPQVCGPDLDADAIRGAVRESLTRTGEDDPTGARLKWNIKHRK